MSKPDTTTPADLAELRRQIEALQKRLEQLEGSPASSGGKAPGAAPAAAAKAPDPIPWTVIMAAIAAVVKEPHRVMSVTLSGLPPLNIWAFEGRRAIFYSHTPR